MNDSELMVVFVVNNIQEVKQSLLDAQSTEQNENYKFCVSRERGQEIEIVDKLGIKKHYLFSGDDIDSFYKQYGNYRFLFRGCAKRIGIIKNRLKEINPDVKFVVKDGVENWIDYVQFPFVKRAIVKRKLSEVYEIKTFPFFVKTFGFIHDTFSHKISKVISNEADLQEFQLQTMNLSPDLDMMVSQVIDIVGDWDGKIEYRCWFGGHSFSSASRYLDYDTDYIVPKEVVLFAMDFAKVHARHLPNSYVMDLAVVEDKDGNEVLEVVELNDLESSGRYAKNNFERYLKLITGQE